MANINEILARAAALRDETALNSISPERAGGIMYDTLIALNELWLQQGAALVISKIYASVDAMEADTAPVSDISGKPLRPGQIVVIASEDEDNGSVYRYNGTDSPSWSLVGNIGNLEPVDSLDSDSTQLPLAAHQGKVLDGKISQLGQQIETPATITNKLEFPYFGYYKTDHSYVDDTTGDKLTKYIEVQEGWEILVNISPDDGVIYTIVAFNSALEVVWDKCVSGNKVNYTYIVPSGIKYLRFGTRSGSAYLTAASVKFPISFAAIKDYVDGEVADLETSITNTEADITKKTSLIRLTYTTSKQATRLLVPASLRQQGLVITYFNGFERIIEEFVLDGSESGNFNDAYWQQNSSWQPVYGLNCEHENTMASLFQNSMLSLIKEWRVGYFMADGSVGISEGLRISDYIPVTSGKTYKIVALSDGEGKPAIVCYDSSYNIVETVLPTSGVFYVGEYTIPSGVSYIRICKRNINASSYYDTAKYAGVWESIPMQEIHPEILKQFSDVDGALYYNGSPITSELSNVVTDLPVSDGTGIESGYAYIDSIDRTIKVKA